MIDLKGKNIIVTGASGGIGNSIIEKLNQSGANILASGTKIEKLCLLYTSPSPRDVEESRMPSSA